MSTRSIIVLGLIIIICIAVIAASALAQAHLAAAFGPFRFGNLPRLFGSFAPRLLDRGGPPRPASPLMASWRGIAAAAASYAFLFLSGLLALFVFPRQLRTIRDSYRHGASGLLTMLGIGLLSALAFACLTVLGVFTFSAFPLPLVVPLAVLLAAWGGLMGLALAVGGVLDRWAGIHRASPVLDLAMGTLALYALARIPVAGPILFVILSMLALGAVIATRFGAGGLWSLAVFSQVEETQP